MTYEGSGVPASSAAARLHQADLKARQRAEHDVAAPEAQRADFERRQQPYRSAAATLRRIGDGLRKLIQGSAPGALARAGDDQWSCELGEANLTWVQAADASTVDWGGFPPKFDVIAYAEIVLTIPSTKYSRGHSLWHCDARTTGEFRWYETAFQASGMLTGNMSDHLVPLPPGKDAGKVLVPMGTAYSLARPFGPTDQGDEQQFVDRWAEWLAYAADGHPPHEYFKPNDIGSSYRR